MTIRHITRLKRVQRLGDALTTLDKGMEAVTDPASIHRLKRYRCKTARWLREVEVREP